MILMNLPISKIVFSPSVALIGQTVLNNAGLIEAIEQMGAIDAAESEGSPLNNLLARTFRTGDVLGGDGDDLAEFAGRQCYRSWMKGRPSSEYHENIRDQGHGSIYAHANMSFQITGVSRTLTHELVRHGIGTATSQESQRYVDAKDMRFVVPPLLGNAVVGALGREPESTEEIATLPTQIATAFKMFHTSCDRSLRAYIEFQPLLIEMAKEIEHLTLSGDEKAAVAAKKRANEAARSVLHNACETRLVWTMNLRAARHVLTLRGDEPADLEIRRLAVALLPHAALYAPHFFNDLTVARGTDGLSVVYTPGAKRI